MGLYGKYILPSVIDWTCRQSPARKQREKVIPLARGNVLEIGIGSGLNLPFYDQTIVEQLTAIDPSTETWNKNSVDTEELPFGFVFKRAFVEDIPADDESFDTVVLTYTLCSISDTGKAFDEIRRVLKKNGRLVFCEHGRAPDRSIRRWQNIVNPVWKRFSGGCTLTRDIPSIIEENRLRIDELETMYIPGWKPASFNYWGWAQVY